MQFGLKLPASVLAAAALGHPAADPAAALPAAAGAAAELAEGLGSLYKRVRDALSILQGGS